MKKIASLIILLAFGSITVAQNNVRFEIIHKLHGEDFAFNQETFSDQGFRFNVDRLQYYISEISVAHDGGNTTQFDDVWILVNAGMSTNVLLGSDSIDSIESISFHIGVDPAHNHLDHTQWSSSHPLGPKNPQMHWGWTAGYRFVAMEGDIGPEVDNNYQFHALGDANYFETTVPAAATADNGTVTVSVYANYAHALNGLNNIENGYVLHSEIGECITVLENFRDQVFSMEAPADTVLPVIQDTTDTTDVTGLIHLRSPEMKIYPLPAQDEVWVEVDGMSGNYTADILDIRGNLVMRSLNQGNAFGLVTRQITSGVYFLQLKDESGRISVSRLIIEH